MDEWFRNLFSWEAWLEGVIFFAVVLLLAFISKKVGPFPDALSFGEYVLVIFVCAGMFFWLYF